ncbi:MAG TPA: DUF2273 domain-containing protein [Firmicutes bacterium]|nr:DUF2273 domain-containing protein [Bacillota bacterium]
MEGLYGFLMQHGGKVLGSLLGLLFGWLVLTRGLLAAVFLFVCLGAGYWLGKRLDEQQRLSTLWRHLFPPR